MAYFVAVTLYAGSCMAMVYFEVWGMCGALGIAAYLAGVVVLYVHVWYAEHVKYTQALAAHAQAQAQARREQEFLV